MRPQLLRPCDAAMLPCCQTKPPPAGQSWPPQYLPSAGPARPQRSAAPRLLLPRCLVAELPSCLFCRPGCERPTTMRDVTSGLVATPSPSAWLHTPPNVDKPTPAMQQCKCNCFHLPHAVCSFQAPVLFCIGSKHLLYGVVSMICSDETDSPSLLSGALKDL